MHVNAHLGYIFCVIEKHLPWKPFCYSGPPPGAKCICGCITSHVSRICRIRPPLFIEAYSGIAILSIFPLWSNLPCETSLSACLFGPHIIEWMNATDMGVEKQEIKDNHKEGAEGWSIMRHKWMSHSAYDSASYHSMLCNSCPLGWSALWNTFLKIKKIKFLFSSLDGK